MNLVVKIIDSLSVCGGKALVLCNEDGEMLPMQVATKVETDCSDAGVVTVSFRIDGERVRLEA